MPHLSRFLSGLALMLTLPLSGCLDTGPDVVCVDVERVLSQSKAAQQANEHLGKVQTILQNGLAAYQEELKKSPESETLLTQKHFRFKAFLLYILSQFFQTHRICNPRQLLL